MPSPRSVVLIDDEPAIGQLIQCALQHDTVHVCTSGRSALSALTALSPDVILCDLRLPDLDGPSVFQWLLKNRPSLAERVVFVSGGATTVDHQRFLMRSARPILSKPFPLRKLFDIVARVAA